MFRGYGGIVILAGLYLLAAKIGDSFSKTLTIFSIFIWAIAAGLFAYLILFRGMKFTFFGLGQPDKAADYEIEEHEDVQSGDDRNAGDETHPPAAV